MKMTGWKHTRHNFGPDTATTLSPVNDDPTLTQHPLSVSDYKPNGLNVKLRLPWELYGPQARRSCNIIQQLIPTECYECCIQYQLHTVEDFTLSSGPDARYYSCRVLLERGIQ